MMKPAWKKVTKGLYGGSATAVSLTSNGTYLLEADGNGIYRKDKTSEWTFVKKTYTRIRSIYSHSDSNIVLACGDKGSVMVSFDDGITWEWRNHGIFPTALWNIIAISDKEWLTHSYHHIYHTRDQGKSWKRVAPFAAFKDVCEQRPEIRTIGVSPDGEWLLGTKIHPSLGGLWAQIKGRWVRIKQEPFAMISSIVYYQDHLLIATGSSRACTHRYGQVKALDVSHLNIMDSKEEDWFEIQNDQPQTGYLDLQATSHTIYVAAYGDGRKKACGGAFGILWDKKRMVPIGERRGHVWRIAGNDVEWISAGVRTVEYSGSSQEWFDGFQNLEIMDLVVFNGSLWISTANSGVICSKDGEKWFRENQGLPEDTDIYAFRKVTGKLFLETEKGMFFWEKDRWVCLAPTFATFSKLVEFNESIYLGNNKGLWLIREETPEMLYNGSIVDVAANSEEIIIATKSGILKRSTLGKWQLVNSKNNIVKLFWLNQQWMGLTDKREWVRETARGWVPCFSYGLKIFNIVPLREQQLSLCTNKGLFLTTADDPSRISSLFVGPNISKVICFQNSYYVGSYTNGLWIIDTMSSPLKTFCHLN